MGKDIESGIGHVANEVVLQIGNTQKWNDMFSERVRNAIDRAAYDVFIEMYFDGVLDGIGEGDVLARHKAEIAKAVMSAVLTCSPLWAMARLSGFCGVRFLTRALCRHMAG